MKSNKNIMQYQLFEKALKEKSITTARIDIDHKKGLNYANGVELSIKYPLSFIEKIKYLNSNKIYTYCFKGQMIDNNSKVSRSTMLSPFKNKNSLIEGTDLGRKRKNKNEADLDYFQLIANSRFSLCPNWAGEWYNHDYGWTYRIIETCFTRSLPIVFRETPYGKNFIKDIKFLWNDENHDLDDTEYNQIVDYNYQKALEYWTLRENEVIKIKNAAN